MKWFWSFYHVFMFTHVVNCYSHNDNEDGVCDKDSNACSQFLHRLKPHQKIGESEQVSINGKTYALTTLSINPPLFEIRDFLTPEECKHFIKVAKKKGLQSSETHQFRKGTDRQIILRDVNKDRILNVNEMMLTIEDSFDMYFTEEDILLLFKKLKMDQNGDNLISPDELHAVEPNSFRDYLESYVKKHPEKRSRYSQQIWLFADRKEERDPVFEGLQSRVQNLTHLHPNLIKKSDFQVVQYGVSGHYNAHHDSAPRDTSVVCCTRNAKQHCRICRYMTVLFYLNDVESGGETAFPVAGNQTYDTQTFMLQHGQNLMQHCDSSNLKLPPHRGAALLWYNHQVDPVTSWLGDLDMMTWHGGCPVHKGEKWIANFWIKVTDEAEESLAV